MLSEMIWHYDQLGMVVRKNVCGVTFEDDSNAWVFRAFCASKGNFKKFIRIMMQECPDKLRQKFWARLAVIKKTWKGEYKWDCTPELDLDEALGVLSRNDDYELIQYCHDAGLCDVGLYDGREGVERGHSKGVPGLRD